VKGRVSFVGVFLVVFLNLSAMWDNIAVIWLTNGGSIKISVTKLEERFEDSKRVIRSRKPTDRQHNEPRKRTNNDLQNTTHKLKSEQNEPHKKPMVNSGTPEC